jgi:hypothetical protein
MTTIQKLQFKWFQFKRRFFGDYYWVGPPVEVGVCDDCASQTKLPYEGQKKVPVRRLIDCDNLYLCRDHWERVRTHPDPEVSGDLKPFLRSQGKSDG